MNFPFFKRLAFAVFRLFQAVQHSPAAAFGFHFHLYGEVLHGIDENLFVFSRKRCA